MWVERYNNTVAPVQYSHNWKFCQYGCMESYFTAHYQSPRQMICLWDKLSRGRARCCNFRWPQVQLYLFHFPLHLCILYTLLPIFSPPRLIFEENYDGNKSYNKFNLQEIEFCTNVSQGGEWKELRWSIMNYYGVGLGEGWRVKFPFGTLHISGWGLNFVGISCFIPSVARRISDVIHLCGGTIEKFNCLL